MHCRTSWPFLWMYAATHSVPTTHKKEAPVQLCISHRQTTRVEQSLINSSFWFHQSTHAGWVPRVLKHAIAIFLLETKVVYRMRRRRGQEGRGKWIWEYQSPFCWVTPETRWFFLNWQNDNLPEVVPGRGWRRKCRQASKKKICLQRQKDPAKFKWQSQTWWAWSDCHLWYESWIPGVPIFPATENHQNDIYV